MKSKEKFISYAQNLEDVMLNRLFGEVEDGFYIDVGACDPVQDSVTHSFYQKGWCGINIEPNVAFFNKLVASRERDINLRVAISDTEGTVNFQNVNGSGISAIGTHAKEIADKLGYATTTETINTVTLTQIAQQYCKDKNIHFLKIDVEGHELQVVKGADWTSFRPEVLVIEAVSAHSSAGVNVFELDQILASSRYRFAWFDGLNRYYVRDESSHLMKRFDRPINIFDHFSLCRNHSWSQTYSPLRGILAKFLSPSTKALIRKIQIKLQGVNLR
jgi:FkbM family methyltransferase